MAEGLLSIREVARRTGVSFGSCRTALHIWQQEHKATVGLDTGRVCGTFLEGGFRLPPPDKKKTILLDDEEFRRCFGPTLSDPAPGRHWRVVVIGDAHFKPGVPLSRAILMGKFITQQARLAEELGENFAVVVIGDWHDMEALSSYDKGKASGENRRFQGDIDVGNQAIRLMLKNIDPDIIIHRRLVTLGNHEYRMQRAANDNPEFVGFLDNHLLAWESEGWEVFSFLEVAYIEDVAFCHYFQSPGNGRAISSINGVRPLLLKTMGAVVHGHTHEFDYDSLGTAGGKKIAGCIVGCAFEHDEDYRGQGNSHMDRGLVVLENLKGSMFRAHFKDFTQLRREFDMPGKDV